MASQITGVSIVCSTNGSGADQRKHECPVSLNFVWGIHRSPMNSPHKRPVTRKMFPFDGVIMNSKSLNSVTKYIPYLALTGELWGLYCEDLGGKWPHASHCRLTKYTSIFLRFSIPLYLKMDYCQQQFMQHSAILSSNFLQASDIPRYFFAKPQNCRKYIGIINKTYGVR